MCGRVAPHGCSGKIEFEVWHSIIVDGLNSPHGTEAIPLRLGFRVPEALLPDAQPNDEVTVLFTLKDKTYYPTAVRHGILNRTAEVQISGRVLGNYEGALFVVPHSSPLYVSERFERSLKQEDKQRKIIALWFNCDGAGLGPDYHYIFDRSVNEKPLTIK
jgi:hypothetical protein